MTGRRSSHRSVSVVGHPQPAWIEPSESLTECDERLVETLAGFISMDDPLISDVATILESMRLHQVDTSDREAIRLAVDAARRRAESERALSETRVPYREKVAQRRDLGQPVVYYMRLGDRCKIGFTVDIDKRRRVIQPEEVLVTEPGTMALERQRHEQFRDLRMSGEWFRYEGALVAHVTALMAPVSSL